MEAADTGLRLKTDWTPLGRHEVEDEEVAYFSPRWSVTEDAAGGAELPADAADQPGAGE